MSSWDRSRNVPWSRAVPVRPADPDTGATEDVDLTKERIWRDLSREAAAHERELEESKGGTSDGTPMSNVAADGSQTAAPPADVPSSAITPHDDTGGNGGSKREERNILGYVGRPYRHADLFRNAVFGGCIGSITGMCFGFMDSMRSASSSTLLKSASRSAQGKFVFQGTYRSGMFFGAFFGAFHTVKYGVRVMVDPGDVGEICAGGAAVLGGLVSRREWRASLPYAVMLVGMDGFHVMMREDGKV